VPKSASQHGWTLKENLWWVVFVGAAFGRSPDAYGKWCSHMAFNILQNLTVVLDSISFVLIFFCITYFFVASLYFFWWKFG
jgi:hypothetical protein